MGIIIKIWVFWRYLRYSGPQEELLTGRVHVDGDDADPQGAELLPKRRRRPRHPLPRRAVRHQASSRRRLRAAPYVDQPSCNSYTSS